MSSTNKTTNYELTQFLATDVPSWLVDYNGDMSKIDTQMHANEVAAQAAQTAAQGAASDAGTAIADVAAINAVLTQPNTGVLARISSAENDIDTIQSLIGNGEPTTTDKTIIGAINELASEIPSGGSAASDVTYDNTASGLTADDVQEAIDEMQTEINNLTPTPTNRRVIFTADSYGTVDSHALPAALETLLDLGSGNFYDFSYPSMGFSQAGGGGDDPALTALEYFQAHASDVTSPSTITDIIITLGLNDIRSNYGSVEEANVTSFINYCKTTYPNAKIHYGFIGNENGATTATDPMVDLYFNMLGVITNVFRSNGCTIIDGIENVMHDALNFSADWIHPNSRGVQELSKYIHNHMLGLRPKYQNIYTFTNSDLSQAYIEMNGDVTTFVPFSIVLPQGGKTGSGFIDLMNLSGSAMRGIYPNNRSAFFPILCTVSGATVALMGRIADSKLQVYSNSSITITAVAATPVTAATIQF